MNKKNLSVVMAGAMLATSVAPVLADTTTTEIKDKYEITSENAGRMIREIENLLDSKKFDSKDKTADGSQLSKFAGTSVYRIAIKTDNYVTGGADVINVGSVAGSVLNNKFVYKDTVELRKQLDNKNNFKDGKVVSVEVYELGYEIDKDGRILSVGTSTTSADVYNKAQIGYFKAYTTNIQANGSLDALETAVDNGWVTAVKEINSETYEISLGSFKDGSETEHNTIKVSLGDKQLDFTKPLGKDNEELLLTEDGTPGDLAKDVYGFKTKSTGTEETLAYKEAKLLTTVEVSAATDSYTVTCGDLYDGLMLTEKGHDLMNEAQEYYRAKEKNIAKYGYTTEAVSGPVAGVYNFKIKLTDAKGDIKVVTVKGNDKTKMDELYRMFSHTNGPRATVDIVAGDNRYETAVEIAKSYLIGNESYNTISNKVPKEIVLVNGEALVDGLAAAPYAKQQEAPILLTKKNSLPTETKDYLIELLRKAELGNLGNITVTIVGGEGVVSNSVVSELKALGLNVDRLAGDDREATSLAVAREIDARDQGAFVVGANGEADAMSAAATAATKGMPIIVSSVHGLSNEAAREAVKFAKEERGADGVITIVGGESVVSKEEEELIKDRYTINNKHRVERVYGDNRQATNAAMIEKFTKNEGMKNVIVAKDGMKSKSELVDALPASVFASVKGAQIVLATDKLTEEQLDAVALNTSKDGLSLYQIGNGVEKSVIVTLAERLGLKK